MQCENNTTLPNIIYKVAIVAAVLNAIFIILLISFGWSKFLPFLFIGIGVMVFNYFCLYTLLKKILLLKKRRILLGILGFFLRLGILACTLGIILHYYNINAFMVAVAGSISIPLSFVIVGVFWQIWKRRYFYWNF